MENSEGLNLFDLSETSKDEIDANLAKVWSWRGPLYEMYANSLMLDYAPEFAQLHRWGSDFFGRPSHMNIILLSSQNIHSYMMLGWETGIQNEFITLRRNGMAKEQVMELVMFSQLHAGMRGLGHVFRAVGENLPSHGLKYHPQFVKVNRAKWEGAIKTLPKQIAPYLMLRHHTVTGSTDGLREAALLARACGITNELIVQAIVGSAARGLISGRLLRPCPYRWPQTAAIRLRQRAQLSQRARHERFVNRRSESPGSYLSQHGPEPPLDGFKCPLQHRSVRRLIEMDEHVPVVRDYVVVVRLAKKAVEPQVLGHRIGTEHVQAHAAVDVCLAEQGVGPRRRDLFRSQLGRLSDWVEHPVLESDRHGTRQKQRCIGRHMRYRQGLDERAYARILDHRTISSSSARCDRTLADHICTYLSRPQPGGEGF